MVKNMVNENERLVYSVREAAKLLGVSHTTLFTDINNGRFTRIIRIGKRVVIPKAALSRYLETAGADNDK
jgi:excisionase family DNA binding protein